MTHSSPGTDATRTESPEVEAFSRGLPERRYRPELHGVRGLAILGVVLFHLFGAGRISGGIDIFLAISGFLFTAMLLREAAYSGGSIQIGRYLARLARRLLPPALLVIAFTTIVGLWLLPDTRHHQLLAEARASLLYFENLELIRSQLGYGAAGPESSPFQHFWSLSVQGQFYLVWPIVTVLAVWLAKRLNRSALSVMSLLVLAVLTASFIFAWYMQGVNQEEAYLMTRTRFWELAFGGLLALLGARLTLPKPLRLPAGWAGVALIVLCGFALDGAALFPGPWALWPLLGLTLVLAAAGPEGGDKDSPGTATRSLSNRPFAFIGNIAYSLYLWHWPLLIFYLEARSYPAVGIRGASVVFAASLVMAWLTYRLVEQPAAVRALASRSLLALAASTLILGAAATSYGVQSTHVDRPDGFSMAGVDEEDHPGAAATTDGEFEPTEAEDFYPETDVLAEDESMYYDWGCTQDGDGSGTGEVLLCEDPDRPENPDATIMLAGGSHAGHWHHALKILAAQNNWELVIADKSGCRFRHTKDVENDTCSQWNAGFQEFVTEQEPDLVVTSGTVLMRSGSEERIQDGAPERWTEITEAGSELLLLRGTARPDEDVPECLADGGHPLDCGPEFDIYADENPLLEEDLPPATYSVDLTENICPDGSCPAVIGGVAVYNDDSHLSTYYVETLAPVLDEKLREEMPHLYE
ncbi:acyltransferase family protein [Nesterenkonia cremea]|uniref:Acyltransferase n=1 Tax=Nesterenkonia cremea TaxID=1882340 RepID=A0A917AT42_9MICC|nr:acyltransferase family protein [Nesterenkonia cremea]GGE68212.1 acyltransferase [Nesterenkonia cremea]